MPASMRVLGTQFRRLLATQSAKPQPPTTPRIQQALSQISILPETTQALQTSDAQLTSTLLNRVLQLVRGSPSDAAESPRPSMGKNYEAVVHGLLARHYHRVGDIVVERAHRLDAIAALWQDASEDTVSDGVVGDAQAVSDDDRVLLTTAHIALALSCLRVPGPEARLTASVAATTAERFAVTEQHRLMASLLTALASERESPRQTMILSALIAMDSNGLSEAITAPVDVPGISRFFLATLAGEGPAADKSAVDHARALVVRWNDRGGFDYVEALCAAADVIIAREGKPGWAQAEDFLSRALQEVDGIGNKLDKGEPLLGLARLHASRGQVVEAEGLYRSIEERFEEVFKHMAFTVSSADLYCRSMLSFASFLEHVEFNGVKREREGAAKREKQMQVKQLYSAILEAPEQRFIPLWLFDSILPHFEMPAPDVAISK